MVDLLENPGIEMIWVDEFLHRKAMALLLVRPDKTYSLCDAVSFVLYGWKRLSKSYNSCQ